MCVNENRGTGAFFLLFDRVFSRTGRLSKLRPRDSESESVSSTYIKSEVLEEKSKEVVESFKLVSESGISRITLFGGCDRSEEFKVVLRLMAVWEEGKEVALSGITSV